MGLYIRSQDKKVLLPNPKLAIDKVNADYYIEDISNNSNYVILGRYDSEKRALEVLDEIQSISMNKKLIKLKANLSQFDMNHLKKAFGADAIVETPLYEIANSTNIIIYEMPKE